MERTCKNYSIIYYEFAHRSRGIDVIAIDSHFLIYFVQQTL